MKIQGVILIQFLLVKLSKIAQKLPDFEIFPDFNKNTVLNKKI